LRDIRDNVVIQIEITNKCFLSCRHCTRHVGHHAQPFEMRPDEVRKAIASLDGWDGRIGLMGGEPAMHLQFAEICEIFKEMIPDRRRREYWTAGYQWGQNKELVYSTFDKDRINYNDHRSPDGKHAPLLVAIEEVVDDPELRALLIDNCPYQSRWSASITPRGAFFCEIAASLDALFDGPGGWPVEPGWWRRTVADYGSQIDAYCAKCSGALPMPTYSDARGGRDKPNKDLVSPGNLERLKAVGSPKALRGDYEIWDKKIDAAHIEEHGKRNPREYRSFVARSPEDVRAAVRSGTIGA
jgi:hypothetical protein